MNQDGSMSSEEYLWEAQKFQEAAERLEQERVALERRQKQLLIRAQRAAQRERGALKDGLQAAFEGARGAISYNAHGVPKRAAPPADPNVDFAIYGFHNAPSRKRVPKAVHPGKQCMTDAMREQQDTGKYPTLSDHTERKSPAFTLEPVSMGFYRCKKLTKEEEDAIRTRAHKD